MQKLFLFFWKNHFTVLFIVLEVIAFSLLVSNNSFQQSRIHESSVTIAGTVYQFQHSYTQYLGLTEENEKLRQSNSELIQAQLNTKNQRQNVHGNFQVIPTLALSSTYQQENNYIIIDAGKSDGIKPASAVISTDGAVGIIHSVSENYSSIIPIIHGSSDISARLKNSSYFGQCKWGGIDPKTAELENIPNHVEIAEGDTIVTRGSGGVFPPNIIIGYAQESKKNESSGFQTVTVRLATDFRKIHSLFVIINSLKPELDSLINQTEEWTGE
jgi:rod shape-determining protein MreC